MGGDDLLIAHKITRGGPPVYSLTPNYHSCNSCYISSFLEEANCIIQARTGYLIPSTTSAYGLRRVDSLGHGAGQSACCLGERYTQNAHFSYFTVPTL
ncbi:hypothetical protein RRG08_017458 [Elysia crispata]|uniref:Uncharacterized protein n=1 Tax=Elysia crispata TaxID=231223 RepID=A0AAE0YHU2_9GAST|nr:hypothetical protein RRG08_017458 [Elysia crispata]